MKVFKIIICLTILNLTIEVKADDTFPAFSETPIKIVIPTTTQFYQHDPAVEIGSNAVYAINGQIFSNAVDGHIQTTAEGFSGTTDKSTPWKTLTELLAVYQQGSDEKKIRPLYAPTSQAFLDRIFTNSDMTARFQKHTSSTTGMQVVMGFDLKDGFVALVKLTATSEPMPFYLVKINGTYLLSTFKNNARTSDGLMMQNLSIFLKKNSAQDLLK